MIGYPVRLNSKTLYPEYCNIIDIKIDFCLIVNIFKSYLHILINVFFNI